MLLEQTQAENLHYWWVNQLVGRIQIDVINELHGTKTKAFANNIYLRILNANYRVFPI